MYSYYTYAHYTADTNTLFYIGKGKFYNNGTRERHRQYWNRNIWWKRKAQKHGFNSVVLCKFKEEEDALAHEILLISVFKSLGFELVNLTNGGEGSAGRFFSEESRKKLREANLGSKRNFDSNTRAMLAERARFIGYKHKGRVLTEEHKS